MTLGLMEYVRAAFGARPLGMFVPPNWLGLGAFALLGLVNPGFWLVGAGLELGYLYAMCSNGRFRNYVEAVRQGASRRRAQSTLIAQVALLTPPDQNRYRALEARCGAILEQQGHGAAGDVAVETQGQGLGRLLWIYLRLLLTRQSIQKVLWESSRKESDRQGLDERIAKLRKQLEDEDLGADLRKSLSSQLEILQQRQEGQAQARQKLDFLNAELTRVEEQAELIREQAVLGTDPKAVSDRIDQVAATLGDTTQWIREQQQIYGQVEDLLVEPPPVPIRKSVSQSQ
jgi:hypothetical protein